MTFQLAVVCEAPADQRIASGIADRLLCEQVDWIDASVLDDVRVWRGVEHGKPFLAWKDVRRLAQAASIRAHGHFGDEPGLPDSRTARRAIRVLKQRFTDLVAILLIRDSDGEASRHEGLKQARNEETSALQIVLGVANPKREAWVLAGFEPNDDSEQNELNALIVDLEFSPVEESHRLTAKEPGSTRDAKRVLKLLCPTPDREEQCWRNTPLCTLTARGMNNGLAAYIQEVDTRLVPLFTGRRPN